MLDDDSEFNTNNKSLKFIMESHCSAAVSHPFLSHYIIEPYSPRLWLSYNLIVN